MKTVYICFAALLYGSTAYASDVIPQEFRGTWVVSGECVSKYMNAGDSASEWNIGSKVMGGYEWGSELIKGTGSSSAQGVFTGKFKDSYGGGDDDGKDRSTKTFKLTGKGMTLTTLNTRQKNSKPEQESYVHCTVDDYKTAMRRLGRVLIGKPLTKEDAYLGKEQAQNVLIEYNKKPEFGLTPKQILKTK